MLRFFGGLVIVVALHLTGVSLASAAAVDSSAHKPNRLTTAQIEQLVSPIALYPDGVLAQILLAATYPLEVAQAAHWSQENPTLTGKELEDAMVKQMWNPAVKGLTAAPEVLQMMMKSRNGHNSSGTHSSRSRRMCSMPSKHFGAVPTWSETSEPRRIRW